MIPGTEPYSRIDAMPNLYLVCKRFSFLYSVVSKNACTSIKAAVLAAEGRSLAAGSAPLTSGHGPRIHNAVGYRPSPGWLVPIEDEGQVGRFSEFSKIAVVRDPVDRLISTYCDKVLGASHVFFDYYGLRNISFDAFLAAIEQALEIADPLHMDEHIRPQAYCIRAEDLDELIHIKSVGRYFDERLGIRLPVLNRGTSRGFVPTYQQRRRIRGLYACDLELQATYP